MALKHEYPYYLKPKVYIRKAECHFNLQDPRSMEVAATTAFNLIHYSDFQPEVKGNYCNFCNFNLFCFSYRKVCQTNKKDIPEKSI